PEFGLDIAPGRIETTVVEDSGWAHPWKNHFKPFPVGRRLWITPTWYDAPPLPERIVIELDPGMAFGSGLHASTQLCLTVLEDRIRGGERVFDCRAGAYGVPGGDRGLRDRRRPATRSRGGGQSLRAAPGRSPPRRGVAMPGLDGERRTGTGEQGIQRRSLSDQTFLRSSRIHRRGAGDISTGSGPAS